MQEPSSDSSVILPLCAKAEHGLDMLAKITDLGASIEVSERASPHRIEIGPKSEQFMFKLTGTRSFLQKT